MEQFFCFTSFSSLKLYINGPQNKYNASSTHFSWLLGPEHMCARYPLLIGWQLSHHLVSGESTLHQVALFETRSRIFLPIAQSCAALFRCLLAILASSLGWLVGNNSFFLFCFLDCRGQNTCAPGTPFWLVDNCHTTWSQGNLHYIRLHFLKLDREFFCLLPSLRGSILLPPSHPSVFARMARWQ